ncbi:hypothetical protein GWK47_039225 [Chionoecetes opilio]|uniref:Uncharacterized protein n=1 Tax=Chionoecetes opilio TaxID=41210 RepID=A0A8J5D0H2_CHIOP|nr:hypothetical protein GWK47_039225 [Chionoecetes opilio]
MAERRSTPRLPAPPSSPQRRAAAFCGHSGRRGPSEFGGKMSGRACRARFAALASGRKGVKGLAGGLPPRRVRIKRPLWKGKRPAHFALVWNHGKKRRRRGERGKPRSKQWRPRRARMKRTSSYLPLPHLQEDGEQLSHTCSVWPPTKLLQVAVTACYDGGGMHRRALYQAEPATACCC